MPLWKKGDVVRLTLVLSALQPISVTALKLEEDLHTADSVAVGIGVDGRRMTVDCKSCTVIEAIESLDVEREARNAALKEQEKQAAYQRFMGPTRGRG